MNKTCYHIHFGLIVTGQTEENHLTALFRSLSEIGVCNFKIIRRCKQLRPITSQKERKQKQKLQIVGTEYSIHTQAEEEIGLSARAYINNDDCRFVLLIDDLEYAWRSQLEATFIRYRNALNGLLRERKHQASVHFLVNMLEAYYFADAQAINNVLGTKLSDYDGDVEEIQHPKNELKKHYPGFREKEHGGAILTILDMKYVLANLDTCASLRTMFLWYIKMVENSYYGDVDIPLKSSLENELLNEITKTQLP